LGKKFKGLSIGGGPFVVKSVLMAGRILAVPFGVFVIRPEKVS